MDLVLNNLQRLISHKTQPTKPIHIYIYVCVCVCMCVYVCVCVCGDHLKMVLRYVSISIDKMSKSIVEITPKPK